MRAWFLLLCLLASAGAADPPSSADDLGRVPVLHQRRIKPLAIAAEEIVQSITGRAAFGEVVAKPQGDHVALELTKTRPAIDVLAQWLRDPPAAAATRVLYCPWLPLQRRLGFAGQWVSVSEADGDAARAYILGARMAKGRESRSGERADLEPDQEKAVELGARLDEAREAFAGRAIALAPLASTDEQRQRVLDALVPALADQPATRDEPEWRARLRQVIDERARRLAAKPATDAATAAAQPVAAADPGLRLLADADIWLTVEDLALRPDPLLERWPGAEEVRLFAAAWGEALRAGDAASIAATSRALTAALRGHVAPRVESYPSERMLAVELAYRRLAPFVWALALYLIGGICAGIGFGALERRRGVDAATVAGRVDGAVRDPVAERAAPRGNWWLRIGVAATLLGILATLAGLGTRLYLTRLGAVTNLYETIIFNSLVAAVLGLALARGTRNPVFAVAGGIAAAMCALVGEMLPPDLGSNLSQLQPVLRSRFWLTVHVLTIVSSYGAFLVALVLGNIALARAALTRRAVPAAEGAAIYRALQVGVVLCAAGTLLGGVWADKAWGRFWGWDPKEVWALVILLTYIIPLHLRYIAVVGPTGLAAWAVFGFLSVMMSWYGVNFVLGAGLHAYAFGEGGLGIVLPLCLLQIVVAVVELAAISAARRQARAPAPAPTSPAT